MANPTSQYKSCPICSRECVKYVMFHLTWYWRCKDCKVNADDPVPSSKGYSVPLKAKAWDDEYEENTQPTYRHPYMGYSSVTSMSVITALPIDCKMSTIMTTKNFHGVDEGDVKIHATATENGVGTVEVFQEKFPITAMNNGHEDEMWEDLARSVLQGVMYFNVEEIKSEYLKLRLSQRYPNKKIVCI